MGVMIMISINITNIIRTLNIFDIGVRHKWGTAVPQIFNLR